MLPQEEIFVNLKLPLTGAEDRNIMQRRCLAKLFLGRIGTAESISCLVSNLQGVTHLIDKIFCRNEFLFRGILLALLL